MYVWDWFVQLFMGVFTLDQSCIILDLLFSLPYNDTILICLSVAMIDELRPVIMKNGFEKMMTIFTDLKNNIPLIDFPRMIQKALLIYTTTPKSIFREFRSIDERIREGVIDEDFHFHASQLLLDLSSRELMLLKTIDLQNLLVIDCYNILTMRTETMYRMEGALIFNVDDVDSICFSITLM